jgi:RecG-like helicase
MSLGMTFGRRLRRRTDDDTLWPDTTEALVEPTHATKPIDDAPARVPVLVAGRIKSLRVQPLAGVATLRATIADDSGQVTLVFLGRRHIAGIEVGRKILCEGVIGEQQGRRQMLNPVYRLL